MHRVSPAISSSIWVGVRQVHQAQSSLNSTLTQVHSKLTFLIIWVASFIAFGVVYATTLRPDFIATTQILLQPKVIVNDGPEAVRHFEQFRIDGEQCETELHILKSETLLFRVFDALDIENTVENYETPDGFWSFLSIKFERMAGAVYAKPEYLKTFYAFAARMRARRLGLSYVIEISYRASSPDRAISVVNSIASAYAVHRIHGVLAREQAQGVYREERLTKLQKQLIAAENGMRLGRIPDDSLSDADVRLLGSVDLPMGVIYPKFVPIVMFAIVSGAITGLLIVMLSPGRHSAVLNQPALVSNRNDRSRIA